MNAESFYEYLQNPSKLYQVSYQELKSLVMLYPYSPNIRYLLLAKSILDKQKDENRNLQLAALYSPDRKWLRKKIKQLQLLVETGNESYLHEDFLELRDLAELEMSRTELHEEPIMKPVELSREATVDVDIQDNSGFDFKEKQVFDLESAVTEIRETIQTASEIAEAEIVSDDNIYFSRLVNVVIESSAAVEKLVNEGFAQENKEFQERVPEAEADAPDPKSSFNSWLKQFQPPHHGVPSQDLKDVIQQPSSDLEYEEPEDVAKEMASKSILEDDDIVSLSLAALLEGQGHYEKAIAMYEKLSLHYPEKSSFFAAKIEKLKQK